MKSRIGIKLIEEYTAKEKEMFEIYTKLFNIQLYNQKIMIIHLIKHLYIILFLIIMTIIGVKLL